MVAMYGTLRTIAPLNRSNNLIQAGSCDPSVVVTVWSGKCKSLAGAQLFLGRQTVI
jgi:hypothetical protein